MHARRRLLLVSVSRLSTVGATILATIVVVASAPTVSSIVATASAIGTTATSITTTASSIVTTASGIATSILPMAEVIALLLITILVARLVRVIRHCLHKAWVRGIWSVGIGGMAKRAVALELLGVRGDV